MMQPNGNKGISLHIGLNSVDSVHYQGWDGELVPCETDAEDMKMIADDEGYESQILLTSDATRENVTDHITSAAESLSSNDIFFLSYSGHGGQLPDRHYDEEDLMNETMCLYNGQLVDDELFNLFGKFQAGVRIIVFADSCHSGTVTKRKAIEDAIAEGKKGYYKAMPDDVASRVYKANRDMYDPILTDPSLKGAETSDQVSASVLLISACQDNQLALAGIFNSWFTANLLRVWRNGLFKGDYKKFHQSILDWMQTTPDQSPNYYLVGERNRAFERQHPFEI